MNDDFLGAYCARVIAVDYRATSDRIRFEAIPAPVVAAVTESLGSGIARVYPPVTSGFGGQFAGRVDLADGRSVFLKAAPWTMRFNAESLEREARMLRAIGPGMPTLPVLVAGRFAGWQVLGLPFVKSRMPGDPWSVADLDTVFAACHAVARMPAEQARAITKEPWTNSGGSDDVLQPTIERLQGGAFSPDLSGALQAATADLVATARRFGPELVRAYQPIPQVHGSTLCHNDLRPDNILIDASGSAVVVDWNWVGLGPAWIDAFGLLPMAHRQGVDVAPYLDHPLLDGAPTAHLDAFLAMVTIYMLHGLDAEPAPGITGAMAWHRARYAADFLGLLADRQGWTDC